MTTIPIPSGPTNKEIIDRAFQILGTSGTMFGRTEDEYADAVLVLGGMLLEWPFDQLGAIVEDAAGLRVEEESGIDRKWLNPVAYSLAEELGHELGKMLSPSANRLRARGYSRICSFVADTPAVQNSNPTVRGSGRLWYNRGAFFPRSQ